MLASDIGTVFHVLDAPFPIKLFAYDLGKVVEINPGVWVPATHTRGLKEAPDFGVVQCWL